MKSELDSEFRTIKDGLASGEVESVIILRFDQNSDVYQIIEGKLELFKALGAVDALKYDLLNQCDKVKKGDIETK